jgi:hypothetical protein
MMELIAAAVREREGAVSLPHARQLGGQIGELIGDQMEHFAFPLHPAPNRDHAGGQNIGLIAKHFFGCCSAIRVLPVGDHTRNGCSLRWA